MPPMQPPMLRPPGGMVPQPPPASGPSRPPPPPMEEPPSKKQKTEENLIPEDVFLQKNKVSWWENYVPEILIYCLRNFKSQKIKICKIAVTVVNYSHTFVE